MGKITLAEAVKLKSILTKRILELEQELRRTAFATVEKGETPTAGPRTFAEVDAELNDVRKDSRILDRLIYRANIDHVIEFKGEILAIVEAIELATQLRAKARLYKEFSAAKKEEIVNMMMEKTLVRIALFNPEDLRQTAVQLEKDAHKLSNLINAKNYAITLDFDDSKYF